LENPDEPARAHRNERYTPGRARESAESRSPPWLARSVARPCLRSSAALDAAGEDGVNMTIIVTGAAGFVGYFTAERLLKRGEAVIGVDDFNAYYEPGLKEARAARLSTHARFSMARMDVADAPAFAGLVKESGADKIVHLAAQAGVRYSMQAPFAYERSNIAGHLSVLEACRNAPAIEHLVYASSSSVYGDRAIAGPFREDDPADAPVSLYAATKRSCELLSVSYSKLYGLKQSGLRFFTVYGPMGRPDMAYFSFTRKILSGEPIEVYGYGEMARDFTYIDDIVDGVLGVLDRPPAAGEARLFNIGDSRPAPLMRMIEILEKALGRTAEKILTPMQPGDVTATYADISRLQALTGYQPKVVLEDGLPRFVAWYRAYYGI
jgi:UDP-glucuronate 4-epimerase